MKGLLWKNSLLKTLFGCVFLPLLLAFLLLPVFSSPVSALELTGGNALVLNSGTITTDVQTRNGTKSHSDLIFDFPGTESFVYGLSFDYSSTAIPSTNYLLSFDVTYISSLGSAGGSNYTGHFRYDGLESQTMSKIFESCVDNHNTPITNGGVTQYIGEGQVTCSYIFFAHSSSYTSFTSRNDSRIWFGVSSTNNRIIVSPGFVRGISWNGLTQDDRTWLEDHMPSGSTPAQVEQSVQNAIEAQREQERQEFDDEASQGLDTLDDNTDQQAIDNKMTSIMSVITNFVTAITHPVISTCILPMDFRNYAGAGFYEVDLCHLSPPSGITNVLNVIFLFFVLGLAYSAIRSVIQMYKEVIDG